MKGNEEKIQSIKMQDKSESGGVTKFLFNWIIPVVAAIIVAQLITRFLVFKVAVPTESMVPTVEPKDQFFVTRLYNPESIKRGDIVVFKSEEFVDLLMKRVIGLPGDKIDIKDDGKVFINGEEYVEKYVKNPSDKKASFVVPQGKYVMLGDNRANSDDSRYWNNPYIDGSNIKGKVRIRVYPFNRIGSVN